MESSCYKMLFDKLDEIIKDSEITLYGNDIIAEKLYVFFREQSPKLIIHYCRKLKDLLESEICGKHILVYCDNRSTFSAEFKRIVHKKYNKIINGKKLLCCEYLELEFILEEEDAELNREAESDIYNIEKIERVIEIAHYGRSGSIFLHGLLENHPDLCGLPPGIFYNPIYDLYLLFLRSRGRVKVDDLVKLFIASDLITGNYQEYIKIELRNENRAFYEKRNLIFYDRLKRVFLAFYKKYNVLTEKFVFKALNYLYTCVYSKSNLKEEKIAILNQLHTTDYKMINKYLSYFKECRVIISVRHPVQNMASIYNLLDRRGELNEVSALGVLQYLYQNQLLLGLGEKHKLLLVQIEKINRCRDKTIRDLLSELELEYSENCLIPSINGLEMLDEYSGSNKRGTEKPYYEYMPDEILFSRFFAKISEKLGYFEKNDIDMKGNKQEKYFRLGKNVVLSKSAVLNRMQVLGEQKGRIVDILDEATII